MAWLTNWWSPRVQVCIPNKTINIFRVSPALNWTHNGWLLMYGKSLYLLFSCLLQAWIGSVVSSKIEKEADPKKNSCYTCYKYIAIMLKYNIEYSLTMANLSFSIMKWPLQFGKALVCTAVACYNETRNIKPWCIDPESSLVMGKNAHADLPRIYPTLPSRPVDFANSLGTSSSA